MPPLSSRHLPLLAAVLLGLPGCHADSALAPDKRAGLRAPVSLSPTDLGTLGGFAGVAERINARGDIVGGSLTAGLEPRATLWREGSVVNLGTLGGFESDATDLNDLGVVAGWSETTAGPPHAFRWEHGTLTDLGTLGGVFSFAFGINNRGTSWAPARPPPGRSMPSSGATA